MLMFFLMKLAEVAWPASAGRCLILLQSSCGQSKKKSLLAWSWWTNSPSRLNSELAGDDWARCAYRPPSAERLASSRCNRPPDLWDPFEARWRGFWHSLLS